MATLAQQQRRLVEQQRRQQVAVRSGFLAEFLAAWGLLNVADLDATLPGWLRVIMRLIRVFRQESADLALDHYRELRRIGAPEDALPMPEVAFDLGDLVESERRISRVTRTRRSPASAGDPLRWTREPVALRRDGRQPGLTIRWDRADSAAEVALRVTGPINIKARVARGESPERAARAALVEASGAASRQVLNGGRNTQMALVHSDRAALGWVRVTDSNPCSFCSMLASRSVTWGPYAKDSFAKANEKFSGKAFEAQHADDPRIVGRGQVKVHDHCQCGIAVVFRRDDPLLDQGKRYRELWDAHIRNRYSGEAALRAWRRLHERPEVFLRKAAENSPRPRRRAA